MAKTKRMTAALWAAIIPKTDLGMRHSTPWLRYSSSDSSPQNCDSNGNLIFGCQNDSCPVGDRLRQRIPLTACLGRQKTAATLDAMHLYRLHIIISRCTSSCQYVCRIFSGGRPIIRHPQMHDIRSLRTAYLQRSISRSLASAATSAQSHHIRNADHNSESPY